MPPATTWPKSGAPELLVVDSSAVLAMLFEEPEASACAAAVGKDPARCISAANYAEAGTVLAGRAKPEERQEVIVDLDTFLDLLHIEIVPVTRELAQAALQARLRYGRGFGTGGKLNFGDCFAYALAKVSSAPLLFVGNDFAETDIEAAQRRPLQT